MKVSLLAVKEFLDFHGFKIYSPESDTRIIIRVEGKYVTVKQKDDLIRFLYKTVENYEFDDPDEEGIVFEKLTNLKSKIKSNIENWLQVIKLNFISDTEDTAYKFFTNGIVAITEDSIELKNYDSVKGHVWYDSVLTFEINVDDPESSMNSGDAYSFLFDISKSNEDHDALMSLIGYLVHTYKSPTNSKAVVIYDSNVSMRNPSGGTGKSLLCRMVGEAVKSKFKNGKRMDLNNRFVLSDITIDDNLIILDDIPENFQTNRLFPDITGDMVIERKYENSITIPAKDSPKILINSNYPLLDNGYSYERRKHEFVITSIYGKDLTPEDQYGKKLIDDWDDDEWNSFYNLIFLCLQKYLSEKLLPQSRSLQDFLLENSFDEVTLEIAKSLEKNKDYDKTELYKQYKEKTDGYKVKQPTFTANLKEYASLMNYSVNERHSGDKNYIAFY